MIHPPPRTALPPPPSDEEDDESAFDYEQYSRTDNEDDEGEDEMYSAHGSPFKGHEGAGNRSAATTTPFHVFDPPESTRFASPAPELSFVTTSTAESSTRSARGSVSGSMMGPGEGVMIRESSEHVPSPIDGIAAGDKSGMWDDVGRNRQRSVGRTNTSGSGSGSASGNGASTPGYGLAPAILGTGSASSSSTHLSRPHYSPLAMQRPSLTLRTSSYGQPPSSEDFAGSPLSREISQLRIGSETVQGRTRSGTVSSRTSLSSMGSRPTEDIQQSDTSRRNSLHRSVLDRNSSQQLELGAGFLSRSTTAQTADKWLESSDYDSDVDGVPRTSRRAQGRYQPPATEWSHRYYGETSFQSETELEGHAVGLVEDGKSRIIDAERMASWGGVTRVTERLRNEAEGQFDGGVIEEFDGATHLLLSHVGLGEQVIDLLAVLLPVVASTLVVLDISNNLLLDPPPSLARCHALEELNLSENPILIVPSWIGELTNLRMVMADGCGLKTLPAELAKARLLHTICVRRNRMINLPSWLSQLCKLETLLIDDNPFAGYWQQMISNILVQPTDVIPPVPPVPSQFRRPSEASSPSLLSPVDSPYPQSSNASLASIHSPRLRSLASPSLLNSPYHDVSRHASEITLSPNITQPQSASSSGYFETASPGSSRVTSPPLPAVPGSSRSRYPGLQPSRPAGQNTAPTRKPSKALKRMRSAGALLGLRMEEGYQHGAMSSGEMETLVAEPEPERYNTRQGQPSLITTHDGDISSDEEQPRPANNESKPPNKTGKWGFLKKMSMSKMRGTTITRNPPSDPAKLQKRNPPRIPKSASTMPTMRRLPEDGGVSEFGVNLPRDARTSPALSATVPIKGSRAKRRSFLPILDAPPSLDIPIPTVSGFDASLATFPNSPTVAQHVLEDKTNSPPLERAEQGPHGRTYDIGLKSIMSYLRDLYDLSLPIPVLNTGAEVVHSDASGASGSVSATSEPRVGSPLANGRVLPTVGRRSRRPTIVAVDMDDSRVGNQSPLSIGEINAKLQGMVRPDSVARQAPEEPVHQKKYKDDSVVRTGVIRHILDTERSYVQGLRELVDIYVKPASLPVKGSNESVIPHTERKIVFGGIEGILQFHEVSFLPTLETAAKDLLRNGDDASGERSKRVAREIGEAFRTYHPFMRQYSTYINNFDFALSRLASWAVIHEKFASSTTTGVGLGISTIGEANSSQLTPAQRKRVKHFMKACRKNPKHTQINLESYLLLPVQRIPRYRMLLDSLARSTPPSIDISLDPIEEALEEMVALASTMNEEKRDAESRQRLVKWQSRIRGRFASPLVQAHRRLLLDGSLLLTRIVKRSSTFVEVSSSLVDDNGNNENTITNAKTIVQIEALAPEVPNRQLAAIVTSDLMILCKDPSMGKDPNSQLDLYAVLKMQTKRKPATLLQGSGIRLVDNKAILYLSASSTQEAANWVRIINNEFDPLR